MKYDAGKCVDCDIGDIASPNVGKLRLLVIRLNPDIALDHVDHLHTRRNQLPILYMTFANRARYGSDNARISQIDIGDDDCCLLGLNICPVEVVFCIERRPFPLLGFERCLAA